MTKAVEKKENNAVAAYGQPSVAIGAGAVEAKDILIPKILLMQPISELVTEGTAASGSFVRSTDGSVVCSKDKTLEFIPIQYFKMWVVMKRAPNANKFEFETIEPYTAQNSDAPREWQEGEYTYQRNENLCFYGLLPTDIEKEQKAFDKAAKSGDLPDSDDCLLPCLVSFQRTSRKAGQVIASHFSKLEDFAARLGKPIPRYTSVFNLSSELTKGDKGTYYVFKVEKGRKTNEAEAQVCERWTKILGQARVQADHSDLETREARTVDVPETDSQNGGRTF